MTAPPDIDILLSQLEERRRETQRQLDLIDRQIIRRMTGLIPKLVQKRHGYGRGKAPDPADFLERYRVQLGALTAERQPEIDALSRELALQDQAISRLADERVGRCDSAGSRQLSQLA